MAAAVSSGRARCAWFGSAIDRPPSRRCTTADEFILDSDRQDAAGILLHPRSPDRFATIVRRIERLEQVIGCRLFVRHTDGVSVTVEGFIHPLDLIPLMADTTIKSSGEGFAAANPIVLRADQVIRFLEAVLSLKIPVAETAASITQLHPSDVARNEVAEIGEQRTE